MIRVVVAVAMAAALLSAALPAVEMARVDRTTAAVERVPDRIDRAALSTLASEPAYRPSTDSVPAARRVVTFSLPGRSLTTARVRSLALCSGDVRGTAVLVHAVGDESRSWTALSAPYDLPDGGIALGGRGQVSLSLVPIAGGSDGTDRLVRVRPLTRSSVATAGVNSSTEPEPAGPCDSSTGSAIGAVTSGEPPTNATAPLRSSPVRVPAGERLAIPAR
ncbi:hypothetical protein ACFQFH_04655 [Halobaculum halobium]|uniref:DUF7311 domain-containing protein n=1 Tax=Halobaculum halobium TaxID=3032281 RepID=A0ABD5T7N1_9EURY|nr:hypothetical protein [Halobaculum sp. SYNS20]